MGPYIATNSIVRIYLFASIFIEVQLTIKIAYSDGHGIQWDVLTYVNIMV